MNLDYQLGFYHKALGEGHGRGQKQFKKTDTRTYIRKMIKKKKIKCILKSTSLYLAPKTSSSHSNTTPNE
jgi:hypothetical protein